GRDQDSRRRASGFLLIFPAWVWPRLHGRYPGGLSHEETYVRSRTHACRRLNWTNFGRNRLKRAAVRSLVFGRPRTGMQLVYLRAVQSQLFGKWRRRRQQLLREPEI